MQWLKRTGTFLRRWIFGIKHPGSTDSSHRGSDRRRMLSRATFVAMIIILVLAERLVVLESTPRYAEIFALIAMTWAGWFFFVNVVWVTLNGKPEFQPDGQRLAIDAVLSGCNWIISSAFYFAVHGIEKTGETPDLVDHLYFSAVTFSTLGYGDFQPVKDARPLAAIEAVVGNLHLGVLVAAAFLVASQYRSDSNQSD